MSEETKNVSMNELVLKRQQAFRPMEYALKVLSQPQNFTPQQRFEAFKLPSFVIAQKEFVNVVNKSGICKQQFQSIDEINAAHDSMRMWLDNIKIPIEDLQLLFANLQKAICSLMDAIIQAKRDGLTNSYLLLLFQYTIAKLEADPNYRPTREDAANCYQQSL